MPNLSRRREEDLRAERFESEVRISDLKAFRAGPSGLSQKLYTCTRCGKSYVERSRHCPRCDTRSMAEIRAIPEEHRNKVREKEIRRLRRKHGL